MYGVPGQQLNHTSSNLQPEKLRCLNCYQDAVLPDSHLCENCGTTNTTAMLLSHYLGSGKGDA